MRIAVALGGLAAAVTSYFWFHVNPIPGLVLTIIVLGLWPNNPES